MNTKFPLGKFKGKWTDTWKHFLHHTQTIVDSPAKFHQFRDFPFDLSAHRRRRLLAAQKKQRAEMKLTVEIEFAVEKIVRSVLRQCNMLAPREWKQLFHSFIFDRLKCKTVNAGGLADGGGIKKSKKKTQTCAGISFRIAYFMQMQMPANIAIILQFQRTIRRERSGEARCSGNESK